MAITLDATSSVSNQSGTGSWSHTVGSGSNRLLFVAVGWVSTDDVADVTYGGTSMTKIREDRGPGDNANSAIYYTLAPDSGSNTIEVSFVASPDWGAVASSWEGVAQQAPEANDGQGDKATAQANISITTSTDGAVVIDGLGTWENTTNVSTTQTEIDIVEVSGGADTAASSYVITGAAGSYTMAYDTSGANFGKWGISAAAFAPATVSVVATVTSGGDAFTSIVNVQ